MQNVIQNSHEALKDAKHNKLKFTIKELKTKKDCKVLDTNKCDNIKKNCYICKNIETSIRIKDAIVNNHIVPYYQPIINNDNGFADKYEALIRIIDEKDNILMPNDFLGISKSLNLYNDITKLAIENILNDFINLPNKQVSINISIEDIKNEDTRAFIIKKVTNFPTPSNIVFEIVESDEINDYGALKDFTEIVNKLGAKISIDDFGTGYSNFNHLAKIDAEYIKIDGELIKNIKNKNTNSLLQGIVNFAKNSNKKVVAEYVEDEEILLEIKKLGIEYSQGYYFSKPIKFEDIRKDKIYG